jgi:hypothetical protein
MGLLYPLTFGQINSNSTNNGAVQSAPTPKLSEAWKMDAAEAENKFNQFKKFRLGLLHSS